MAGRCLGKGHGNGMKRREGYATCHGGKADRTCALCAHIRTCTLGKGDCEESELLAFSSG